MCVSHIDLSRTVYNAKDQHYLFLKSDAANAANARVGATPALLVDASDAISIRSGFRHLLHRLISTERTPIDTSCFRPPIRPDALLVAASNESAAVAAPDGDSSCK